MDILRHKSVALVITDMRMPKADGFDVVSEMKEFYPRLPIVLITASAVNERVRQALAFERVGLLRKPFEPAQLQAAMQAVAASLFISSESAA